MSRLIVIGAKVAFVLAAVICTSAKAAACRDGEQSGCWVPTEICAANTSSCNCLTGNTPPACPATKTVQQAQLILEVDTTDTGGRCYVHHTEPRYCWTVYKCQRANQTPCHGQSPTQPDSCPGNDTGVDSQGTQYSDYWLDVGSCNQSTECNP